MESEEFGNFSSLSFNYDRSAHHIIQDAIFTLLCIIAMITNTILIYTIFRFKRLRIVPNIILANWAISDLIVLLVTPTTYRVFAMLEGIDLSSLFICLLLEIGSAAQVTTLIYAVLLIIDWYMAAYFENAAKKFRKYMKFYIIAIWMLMFLLLCINIVYCLKRYYGMYIQSIVQFFVFMGLFLFIIILQICRIVRKCRRRDLTYPTLMLSVVTAFVFCWFMSFVIFTFGLFISGRAIEIICSICVYCTSIIVTIIMYRNSNDFHACLNRLFKRDRRNYEEADFNFHGSGRKPIVKNIGHCSFNNKEENVFVC